MQLQFSREELKLVAQILEEQTAAREGRLKVACSELLGRVIEHDMHFASDELEDLQDILIAYEKELQLRVEQGSAVTKPVLLQKHQLLENILDKVTEACAMV
jgi:hypothetical protein